MPINRLKVLILLTTTQHLLQVIFEGIAGSSFAGDIAIDSVEINSGSCPGKKKKGKKGNKLHTFLHFYIFSVRAVSFVRGK